MNSRLYFNLRKNCSRAYFVKKLKNPYITTFTVIRWIGRQKLKYNQFSLLFFKIKILFDFHKNRNDILKFFILISSSKIK